MCIPFVFAAALSLGAPFRDGMVFQRDMPARIWGRASAGEKVEMSFAGQKISATAGENGCFKAEFAPMGASFEPRALRAVSSGGDEISVTNVLVGEVWIASGQSNMAVPLAGTNPRGFDRNGRLVSQWTRRPHVRLMSVPGRKSASPETDVPVAWRQMEPDSGAAEFSAVGWYFAREIADTLNVPVGVIGAYVGATSIDSWMPKDYFCFEPSSRKGNEPAVYWNGMIAPFVPFGIRGLIWYQGERNSHPDEWPRYCRKLHAMYDGWKDGFGNPSLKMRFVQIAPWGRETVPQTQCAQQDFADEEPNAAMCVINDIGNLADIHPNDKKTVALRLAALALKYDYGLDGIVADSPRPGATRTEGGKVEISCLNSKRIYIYLPEWTYRFKPETTAEIGFELAGTDGVWHPAVIENLVLTKIGEKSFCRRGMLDGPRIVLSSAEVKAPRSVRYLFKRPWRGCVYNEANLPMGAFCISNLDFTGGKQ